MREWHSILQGNGGGGPPFPGEIPAGSGIDWHAEETLAFRRHAHPVLSLPV